MTTPPKPLKISPASIVFGNNYGDDQKAFLRITNDLEKIVVYRLRTSRPAFYRMPESDGMLEPGQTKDLEMVLKKGFAWERVEVNGHKMVAVTLVPYDEDVRDKKLISAIFNHGQQPATLEVPLTLQPPPS